MVAFQAPPAWNLRLAGQRPQGALSTVLDEVREERGPLRGVFHLAAVLEDGVLLEQSWERFENVLGPKAREAWNLHQSTKRIGWTYS